MRAKRGPSPFLFVLLVACQREAPRASPPSLAARLSSLAGCELRTCEREVSSWKLDRAGWDRLVVEPYQGAGPYAGYARAFDEAVPVLARQLAAGGDVTVRPHFAGDAKNTPAQARARWAVPVQYPSQCVELGGQPLDVVFDVARNGSVRAIVGVDAILHQHAAALDPACAAVLDGAWTGTCFEAAWVIAEAALRGERDRFARACALATGLCRGSDVDRGMRSP